MTFLNEDDFYSVRLLVSRQTLKQEDHSWWPVHDWLFNIFAGNLHIWRPTPPSANQGTRHAVVTGTHGWISMNSVFYMGPEFAQFISINHLSNYLLIYSLTYSIT